MEVQLGYQFIEAMCFQIRCIRIMYSILRLHSQGMELTLATRDFKFISNGNNNKMTERSNKHNRTENRSFNQGEPEVCSSGSRLSHLHEEQEIR